MRLQFTARPDIETCATDGKSFFYNPAFVAGLPIEQLVFVVAHEAGHVANNHPHRMKAQPTFDAKIANVAMDYVVNSQILATTTAHGERAFTPPPDALIDSRFDGLAWENVYRILTDGKNNAPANGQPKPQQQPGQPGQPTSSDPAPGTGTPGTGGQDVMPHPADTPAELAEAEAMNTQQTLNAAQAAKGRGNLPGHIQRMIEEMKAPAVDWTAYLRQYFERATDGRTWKRPRRRSLAAGMYSPSKYSTECPPLVIFRDTSGSTDEFQEQFMSECRAIVQDVRPVKITVVDIDAKVRAVREFTPDDFPASLPLAGGGGTRFEPAIQWLDEQDEQPACAVYLTDLDATHPTTPPACPLLWVSTDPRAPSPTIGERIDMDIR